MNFIENFERSISSPRLDSYRIAGGGDKAAISRYLWNVALCESLYLLLQLIEVGFRNVVHQEISTFAGNEWLQSHLAGGMGEQERIKVAVAKESLRKRGKPITEGLLISELSFGFWTSLLDVRYDRMWPKIIAGVFSAMPRTIRVRKEASARMSTVRNLRNAAVHHHSIWHWGDLKQQHDDACVLLEWICPASRAVAEEIDRFPIIYSAKSEGFAEAVDRLWK